MINYPIKIVFLFFFFNYYYFHCKKVNSIRKSQRIQGTVYSVSQSRVSDISPYVNPCLPLFPEAPYMLPLSF